MVEPVNAPHIWGPVVASDDRNEPVKAKFNFAQEFDMPQFHKVMRLPYLRGKEVDKIRGITEMPQSQSL